MSKPIRILQIVTQMHRAGLETMLMNYYRHIDRDRIQFDFLVHRNGEFDYDKEILEMGGRIFHIRPIRGNDFVCYLKDLKQFFSLHKELKIVHSHLDALSGFVLAAAKQANVDVRIAHSHNNGFETDNKRWARYFAKQLIPLSATHFWGCSKEAIEFMFGRKVLESNRSRLVPNAISLNQFSFSQEQRVKMRKQMGLDGKLVVGHIGRFSQQKNHEFLIKIFNELCRKLSNSVLMLIGEGEEKNTILTLAKQLGIEDKVLFLGVRTDIASLLCAMDVFVLPSLFEGLGIVLIEAQAIGVPSVASNCVAKEVNVTGHVKFLSLDDSTGLWVDYIMHEKGKWYNDRMVLEETGYEIKESACKLAICYEELYYGNTAIPNN